MRAGRGDWSGERARFLFVVPAISGVFLILFPENRKIRNGASLLQDKKNN
jgi:hypothetical protein